ncbi:MAG: hypothetical protein QXI33_01545, partial [Candidatus Pacearchaeota archaeon]
MTYTRMKEEKRDPYKNKERWEAWKAEIKAKGAIPDISKANSDLMLAYLDDMELGLNRGKGSRKGGRKPSRLNDIKGKIIFFSQKFEQKFGITDLTKVTESQIFALLKDMKDGIIKKQNGRDFEDTRTYARDFKAFWNWHIKVNGKKDIIIKSIVEDLDARPKGESEFVFLKVDEIKKLLNAVKFEYKVMLSFVMDAGIRPPTELNNIKVSDLSEDYREVHIRDEIVKAGSFGRTNRLMICPKLLREYIKQKKLKQDDYLFNVVSASANKYLKRYAERLFGNTMTKGGLHYHELSLYDFRHIACCYWGKILDKERDIMHRFGWKQANKVYYYSKFLLDDEAGNFILDETLETEKKLGKAEQENKTLKERLSYFEEKFKMIDQLLPILQNQTAMINQGISATTEPIKIKKTMI